MIKYVENRIIKLFETNVHEVYSSGKSGAKLSRWLGCGCCITRRRERKMKNRANTLVVYDMIYF